MNFTAENLLSSILRVKAMKCNQSGPYKDLGTINLINSALDEARKEGVREGHSEIVDYFSPRNDILEKAVRGAIIEIISPPSWRCTLCGGEEYEKSIHDGASLWSCSKCGVVFRDVEKWNFHRGNWRNPDARPEVK